jgi:hypothetical protein
MRQPGMAPPFASDRSVACLQVASIAGWDGACQRWPEQTILIRNLIAYQNTRTCPFSIWIKGSADMTFSVLPAISNQSVVDATRVRTFRDRYIAWQARDLPARVADALAKAGIDTVGQVARLDRAYFKSRPNLGPKTLRELAGGPKERLTAADVIAGAFSLSLPPNDARETVVDLVIALRRNGFRPSTFKSVQVR